MKGRTILPSVNGERTALLRDAPVLMLVLVCAGTVSADIKPIALEENNALGGGEFSGFTAPTINASGQVAFDAILGDTTADAGLYRTGSGGVTEIVRAEQ
jgi:hypothetical protein